MADVLLPLEHIKALSVVNLRRELDKHGLEKSGFRSDLIKRLEKCITGSAAVEEKVGKNDSSVAVTKNIIKLNGDTKEPIKKIDCNENNGCVKTGDSVESDKNGCVMEFSVEGVVVDSTKCMAFVSEATLVQASNSPECTASDFLPEKEPNNPSGKLELELEFDAIPEGNEVSTDVEIPESDSAKEQADSTTSNQQACKVHVISNNVISNEKTSVEDEEKTISDDDQTASELVNELPEDERVDDVNTNNVIIDDETRDEEDQSNCMKINDVHQNEFINENTVGEQKKTEDADNTGNPVTAKTDIISAADDVEATEVPASTVKSDVIGDNGNEKTSGKNVKSNEIENSENRTASENVASKEKSSMKTYITKVATKASSGKKSTPVIGLIKHGDIKGESSEMNVGPKEKKTNRPTASESSSKYKSKTEESKQKYGDDEKKKSLSRSLWVSGLSPVTKAVYLKELFSQHGKVTSAKVVSCAKTSGTTMSSLEETATCIEKLHKICEKTINVEMAKTDPTSCKRPFKSVDRKDDRSSASRQISKSIRDSRTYHIAHSRSRSYERKRDSSKKTDGKASKDMKRTSKPIKESSKEADKSDVIIRKGDKAVKEKNAKLLDELKKEKKEKADKIEQEFKLRAERRRKEREHEHKLREQQHRQKERLEKDHRDRVRKEIERAQYEREKLCELEKERHHKRMLEREDYLREKKERDEQERIEREKEEHEWDRLERECCEQQRQEDERFKRERGERDRLHEERIIHEERAFCSEQERLQMEIEMLERKCKETECDALVLDRGLGTKRPLVEGNVRREYHPDQKRGMYDASLSDVPPAYSAADPLYNPHTIEYRANKVADCERRTSRDNPHHDIPESSYNTGRLPHRTGDLASKYVSRTQNTYVPKTLSDILGRAGLTGILEIRAGERSSSTNNQDSSQVTDHSKYTCHRQQQHDVQEVWTEQRNICDDFDSCAELRGNADTVNNNNINYNVLRPIARDISILSQEDKTGYSNNATKNKTSVSQRLGQTVAKSKATIQNHKYIPCSNIEREIWKESITQFWQNHFQTRDTRGAIPKEDAYRLFQNTHPTPDLHTFSSYSGQIGIESILVCNLKCFLATPKSKEAAKLTTMKLINLSSENVFVLYHHC